MSGGEYRCGLIDRRSPFSWDLALGNSRHIALRV
jgi:hypothetical protein